MEPAPGMMVTSNVRLVRPIARGSMGSVWLGRHLTLETSVAVKFIAAKGERSPEMVERFAREAKAAAQIKSHHVVRTLDHGVMPGDAPYIVLELLEGETLSKRIARGPMTLAVTKTVVTHVARALTGAHALGIVHRDIKPANIFATTSEIGDFYKVLDFGVAKRTHKRTLSLDDINQPELERSREISAVTLLGVLVGTPEYMSPEQIGSDEPITRHVDLWALSVVAYQCLTGTLPFEGASIEAISITILLGAYTPPSVLNEALPPAVDTWFQRAFAHERADRFDDAEALAATFEAIHDDDEDDTTATRDGAGTSAPAPPMSGPLEDELPTHPMAKHASRDAEKRHRSPLSALALGFVALLVGLGAYVMLSQETEPTVAPVATMAPAAGSPSPAPEPVEHVVAEQDPATPEPEVIDMDDVLSEASAAEPDPRRPPARPSSGAPSKSSKGLPKRDLGF
jgi:serine/threonine protein kinase